MVSIKEAAQKYEPKRMKNIADLEVVRTDTDFVLNEKRIDSNDDEYSVSYFILEGDEYRTPPSVLEQLKTLLESKPDLKTFKVVKKGEGKQTKYTVIPLD